MQFEFPEEDVLLVTDCEEPGPDEGPELGYRWTMVFDRASNVTSCFYLILYYINIFELQIDIYFATRLNILVDIYDNIFSDVLFGRAFILFGSVKYYSDPIFNSLKLFELIELMIYLVS